MSEAVNGRDDGMAWWAKFAMLGGIFAVVPGRLAVAVWSPGLNESGNSLVGTLALEALVRRSGLAIL